MGSVGLGCCRCTTRRAGRGRGASHALTVVWQCYSRDPGLQNGLQIAWRIPPPLMPDAKPLHAQHWEPNFTKRLGACGVRRRRMWMQLWMNGGLLVRPGPDVQVSRRRRCPRRYTVSIKLLQQLHAIARLAGFLHHAPPPQQLDLYIAHSTSKHKKNLPPTRLRFCHVQRST